MALEVKWDPSPVPQPCWPSLQLHKDMERSQFMIYFGTRACLFKVAQFQNQDLNRMLRKLQNIDKVALPKDELWEVEPPGLWAHARWPQGSGGAARVSGAEGRQGVEERQDQNFWRRRGVEVGVPISPG